jgi:Fe-S-cluster-containing dehydrogenase component
MNKWALIVDVARCNNCNNCVLATKDEYLGNEFPGYSAPHPKLGHSWISIERKVRGDGQMVDSAYMPVTCNHCDNAPCVAKAKDGAVRKRPDGIVVIDPQAAKGQRDIVKSCPYQAISWNDEAQVPQIWNFDAHLIDSGWKEPRCAQACPTGAIKAIRVDDAELKKMLEAQGLQVRHPEYGTRPRVHYRNLHRVTKCFVGGNVVAKVEGRSENIQNARVTLRQQGKRVAECMSDSFGDFKLDGLAADSGGYDLEVEHPIFGKARASVSVSQSVVVGSILLIAA